MLCAGNIPKDSFSGQVSIFNDVQFNVMRTAGFFDCYAALYVDAKDIHICPRFSYRYTSPGFKHAELLGRQGILNILRCFTRTCHFLEPNSFMIARNGLSAGVKVICDTMNTISGRVGRKLVITRNWKSDLVLFTVMCACACKNINM